MSVLVGTETLPLGQYRSVFRRPDLVAARLSGKPITVAEARPARKFGAAPTLTPGKMPQLALPPTTVIVSPYEDITATSPRLVVVVEARDAKLPIEEIHLRVNGKEVKARGLGGVTTARGQLRRQMRFEVALIESGNELIAYSLNSAGVRSADERRLVLYEASKPLRPQAWFLGVAVSRYKNPDYNLPYPVPEVERIAQLVRAQEGRLYEKAHVRLLCDSEVTREALNTAREEFLGRASMRDLIIVYLAGHGVKDKRGNYYFLTHDADAARPYVRGYPWHDIHRSLLDGLPAQKVVMLVDTCYAGGASGRAQEEAWVDMLADELGEATGYYILMAGRRREVVPARSPFAQAVIEALGGKLKAEGNVLKMSRLMDYVDRRVIDLTQGALHPVCKTPRNAQNFALAVFE